MEKFSGTELGQKWRREARELDRKRKADADPGPKPADPLEAELRAKAVLAGKCERCPDPYPMHVRGSFRDFVRGRGPMIKLCAVCVVFYDREALSC